MSSIEDMADRFLSAITKKKLDDIWFVRIYEKGVWCSASDAARELLKAVPYAQENQTYWSDGLSLAVWRASDVGYGVRYTSRCTTSVPEGSNIVNVSARAIHITRQRFEQPKR